MTTYEENMEFLSQEQIRKVCPTAFTEKPSKEVSAHYTHIPTFRVIEDMEKLGWGVVSAQQVNARKSHTKGTQKHMITFRNTVKFCCLWSSVPLSSLKLSVRFWQKWHCREISQDTSIKIRQAPCIAHLIWHLATKWFTPLRLYTLFSSDKKNSSNIMRRA